MAQQSFGEASQSFFGDIALGPLQASAAGHPFDPPGTSGSLANLNFARPGFGDASYHSFAGSYALSYTPLPFEKSASTLFQLHGRLKLMPSDLQRLFGFLPPLVTLPVDTSFSLEVLFVAEVGPTVDDQAQVGVGGAGEWHAAALSGCEQRDRRGADAVQLHGPPWLELREATARPAAGVNRE